MYGENLKIRVLLVMLFLSFVIKADEIDMNNLLENIERKTDLSNKTKLENGGVSYIYTREDIHRMQAHNLKDILKSTYPFGYNENKFGLTDPFAVPTATPFMSSKIKVYIDNQEISTGLYGSGLLIYGNMDINFVDHIEIYSGNPTLEFSTEPAFVIIKLYSKIAKKDDGSKISIAGGSYDSKCISGYTTSTLKNGWAYFAYASGVDDGREKYNNYGAKLSRDSKKSHILGTLSKGNHHFLIDAIDMDADSFISMSLFATPKTTTFNDDYLHIGYDTKIDNFSVLLTFDKLDSKTSFEDLNKQKIQFVNTTLGKNMLYSFDTDSKSDVYTAGINYDFDTSSNKLVLGTKYRFKHFKYTKLNLNDIPWQSSGHTQQTTATIFAENQYSFADNKILTTGASYSFVRNNHSVQDDDLLGYRVGYTYTNSDLISKTIASHVESTVDPYLINSMYLSNPTKKVAVEKQDTYMQNIKYENQSNKYEIVASYIVIKNKLLANPTTGRLDAYDKDLKIMGGIVRYTREYRTYDKLELTVGANEIKHLPFIDRLLQYSSTLRNFNTIGKFDIFNEILYYIDNVDKENYYDYSAGIIYHSSDDLSFSIKGTNLFYTARKTSYSRFNPITLQQDKPLKISPIDRKIMIMVEYTF